MKIYAGIGSRLTPIDIQMLMDQFAFYMRLEGYKLRSGGATGADAAFKEGSIRGAYNSDPDPYEIFRPKDVTQESLDYLQTVITPEHWDNCNVPARNLHARNCMIILGKDLKTPVEFVVCWTLKGRAVGGTATGIKVANINNIPVFNLAIEDDMDWFYDKLKIVKAKYTNFGTFERSSND